MRHPHSRSERVSQKHTLSGKDYAKDGCWLARHYIKKFYTFLSDAAHRNHHKEREIRERDKAVDTMTCSYCGSAVVWKPNLQDTICVQCGSLNSAKEEKDERED